MLRVPRLLGRPHRSTGLHPFPELFEYKRCQDGVHEACASVSNFEVNRRPQIDLPPNMRQRAPNGKSHRGRKGLRGQSRGRSRQLAEGGCETRLANLEKDCGPGQHGPPKRRRY